MFYFILKALGYLVSNSHSQHQRNNLFFFHRRTSYSRPPFQHNLTPHPFKTPPFSLSHHHLRTEITPQPPTSPNLPKSPAPRLLQSETTKTLQRWKQNMKHIPSITLLIRKIKVVFSRDFPHLSALVILNIILLFCSEVPHTVPPYNHYQNCCPYSLKQHQYRN